MVDCLLHPLKHYLRLEFVKTFFIKTTQDCQLLHILSDCVIKFRSFGNRVQSCLFGTPKMTDIKGSTSIDTDTCLLHKEWDEALCPICMDHPHHSVLLLCCSYDKGCRPYICNTNYRHSNCLDRFKKHPKNNSPLQPSASFPENPDSSRLGQRHLHGTNETIYGDGRLRNDLVEVDEHNSLDGNNNGISTGEVLGENNSETGGIEPYTESVGGNISDSSFYLKCPLCRGTVKGWTVVEEARQYLNLKQRSCSLESCSFFGNYGELCRHARRDHPTTRPNVVDPKRQSAWRQLENQQDYGDTVSAIRSAMPGAIVLGDYVIENGDGIFGDRENSSGEGSGPLLSSFILHQMIRPFSPGSEPRGLSRVWRRYRRPSGTFPDRRNLWGENLLGLQDDDDDWNLPSGMGEEDVPPVPRRRRRFSRARSEDLP